jgi:Gpi18-like mannosyltransferase
LEATGRPLSPKASRATINFDCLTIRPKADNVTGGGQKVEMDFPRCLMRYMMRWACTIFTLVALLAGLGIRLLLLGNLSGDAREYLLPWYQYAHTHGLSALGVAFTNYPPFYSYLLLFLTQFDRVAAPLALIKAASAVCELGCSAIAAEIVRVTGGGRWPATLAFACVWVAPTALLNGAYWAQSDSMWTLFILISIRLFLAGRNGVPAFGLAFAIKAQSMFLGPFVLGMVLRRGVHWLWLASIPIIYVLVGLPVLFAGRSLFDLLKIYVMQSDFYNKMTMNAANMWVVIPIGVKVGTIIGLVAAFIGGVLLAIQTARIDMEDRERVFIAACASLLLMPFLLPKMHDRYFYAFEVASIALACRNTRYIAVALMAQANGVISYMMFDWRLPAMALAPAALCNSALGVFLIAELVRPGGKGRVPLVGLGVFAIIASGLVLDLAIDDFRRSLPGPFYWTAGAFCVSAIILLLRARLGGIKAKWAPATTN